MKINKVKRLCQLLIKPLYFCYPMTKPKKYISEDDALERMRKYCAYQERCHFEVKKKLYDLGMFRDTQDEILSTLISEDYLNEGRYAQSFTSGKMRIKKWSKAKIRLELRKRFISDYLVRKALAEIDEYQYQDNIDALLRKKYATLVNESSLTRRNKLVSYMLRKGYSLSEIKPPLNILSNEFEDKHDN